MEVEHVTDGKIAAVEVLNEAHAKKPMKSKSRPRRSSFDGRLSRERSQDNFARRQTHQLVPPPQRTLMVRARPKSHPRVLTTHAVPAIGYLDPVFVEMMEELKGLLRYVYQTKYPLPSRSPARARSEWSTAS